MTIDEEIRNFNRPTKLLILSLMKETGKTFREIAYDFIMPDMVLVDTKEELERARERGKTEKLVIISTRNLEGIR